MWCWGARGVTLLPPFFYTYQTKTKMKRYTAAIKHKFTIKAVDEEEAVATAIEELIGLYEAGELDEAITVKKLIASEDESEPEEENDI
jgi:hypothetical protein